jgi:hypothetical protein
MKKETMMTAYADQDTSLPGPLPPPPADTD